MIFVNISPRAPISRLKGFKRHYESSWSKPLHVKLRICERFKNELSERVKLARNENLLFAIYYSPSSWLIVIFERGRALPSLLFYTHIMSPLFFIKMFNGVLVQNFARFIE